MLIEHIMLMAAGGVTGAVELPGNLYTWGNNRNGSLLTGDSLTKKRAGLRNASSYTQVALTEYQGAYLSGDKLFVTKTRDRRNYSSSLTSPTYVGSGYTSVAAGNDNLYTIKNDGSLYALGRIDSGAVGTGDFYTGTSPFLVRNSWRDPSDVQGFPHSTLFIRANNAVYYPNSYSLVGALETGVTWAKGVSSNGAYLMIADDGTLWGYGQNPNGQLGTNDTETKSTPVQIGTSSWSMVTMTSRSSYGITVDGHLYAWGRGDTTLYGYLGNGVDQDLSSPTQIGTNTWKWVYANNNFNQYSSSAVVITAKRSDDTLWAWGRRYGLLTWNSTFSSSTSALSYNSPVLVSLDNWKEIQYSVYYNWALSESDNKLYKLSNGYQLLNNTSDLTFSTIEADRYGILGIGTDGYLYHTSFDDSSSFGPYSNPTQLVYQNPSLITRITGGYGYTEGGPSINLLDSYLYDSFYVKSFNQIGTFASWSMVTGGNGFALGITTDGALYAWGTNNKGQLGLNDTLVRSTPVQVGSSSWAMVSAGDAHVIALDVNGYLYSWGDNRYAQLGDGTLVSRSSPAQVGIKTWNNISTKYRHNLALDSDNLLFAWGNYAAGNITQNTSWTKVAASLNSIFLIDSAYQLWAYGNNLYGKLGLNDSVDRDSPVLVGSGYADVDVGLAFSIALTTANTVALAGSIGYYTLGTFTRSSFTQIASAATSVYAGDKHAAYGTTGSGNFYYLFGNNDYYQINNNYLTYLSSPVRIQAKQIALGDLATTRITLDNYLTYYGQVNSSTGAPTGGTYTSYRVGGIRIMSAYEEEFDFRAAAPLRNTVYDYAHITAISDDGNIWEPRSSPVLISDSGIWSNVVSGNKYTAYAFSDDNQIYYANNTTTSSFNSDLSRSDIDAGVIPYYNIKDITVDHMFTYYVTGEGYLLAAGNSIDELPLNGSKYFGPTNNNFKNLYDVVQPGNPFYIPSDEDTNIYESQNLVRLVPWGLDVDTKYSTPTQIGTASWVQISAGKDFSLMIAPGDALYGWGINPTYQLPITQTVVNSPTFLGSNFQNVFAGYYNAAALDNNPL